MTVSYISILLYEILIYLILLPFLSLLQYKISICLPLFLPIILPIPYLSVHRIYSPPHHFSYLTKMFYHSPFSFLLISRLKSQICYSSSRRYLTEFHLYVPFFLHRLLYLFIQFFRIVLKKQRRNGGMKITQESRKEEMKKRK